MFAFAILHSIFESIYISHTIKILNIRIQLTILGISDIL